jgi:hypothetical protein
MGETLVEVGHLAGVELDVGSADSDSFDLDEQLTLFRLERGYILDKGATRAIEDEGAH